MNKIFKNVQPQVAEQTQKVAMITGGGVILMWIAFFVLHLVIPEKVAFDYTVFLAGAIGGLVAVLVFFLMGLTVQKVVATEDESHAKALMRAGYSRRMMIRVLWGILALVAPCFHPVAGILPLIFPNTGIKLFYKWMAGVK
ncbi:MAG: hypothetical protein Q4B47_02310 [Eubacteriales bacterium]|nr:hypothetical protein [Eubacteriales bacterium]